MKEELFLFYREHLRPHIQILFSHLRYRLRTLPIAQRIPAIQNPKTKHRHLVLSEEDLRLCQSQGIPAKLFDNQSINDLDVNALHILHGAYDNVIFFLNYLRGRGYKALWNQTIVEGTSGGNIPMWRRRVSVVEAIYADLITEKIKDRDFLMDEKTEWIDFEREIFKTYLENKEEYKIWIEEHLRDDWDLSRINPITISIILEAISEYQILKTDKLVLITQSVKTAKNYCGDGDYKIINAILDNHFRAKN